MDPRHAVLFEPVVVGPVTLPNRFYQVPHATGFGSAKPRAQAAFRGVRAEGGWGGVCVDYSPVSIDSEETPVVGADLWDDADRDALAMTASAIHAHGSLAGIELHHGGSDSANGSSRSARIAPSTRGSAPMWASTAREMTVDDIVRVQADFVRAAIRARDAGFDIVYVYGAHGYLLSQFMSTVTNTRTDGYGGSLDNRARFHRETLEGVRAAVGDTCAIATRICIDGRDGLPGIHIDEMLQVVTLIDPLVDLFDVTVGSWPENSGTSRYFAEGHERPWALRVREATAKPVVGVGRYTSPDLMAAVIRTGAIDLIGSARPAIADPFLPRKIAEGRLGDIRECTGSNVCILREEEFGHIGCIQNPTAGEEYRRGWHPENVPPTIDPQRPILIVGAGPAGLECAVTLGRRGFDAVHLVEADEELGGHLRAVRRLPTLGDWGRVIDWRMTQIQAIPNVEVITGRRLTAREIVDYGAEIVIMATGSSWCSTGESLGTGPAIEGASRAMTPERILAGARTEGPVIVYDADGYFMGPGVAEMLALEGFDVHLVTPHPVVSPISDGTLEGEFLRRHLHDLGITAHTQRTVTAVEEGRVTGLTEFGEPWSLAAGGVVLVTHRLPCDDVAAEVRALADGLVVHVIGDALSPRMPSEAVFDGHRLAREIDEPDPGSPSAYRRERVSLHVAGSAHE